MIDRLQVEETLRKRFGSAIAESPGLAEGVAGLLSSYAPYRATFGEMAARVEDYLFNALYDRLGQRMTVRTDRGEERRILTGELPDAADDLMGVLFSSLKPYSVNYDKLHEYFMETGSLAAARILYARFSDMIPYQEKQLFSRILSERCTDAPSGFSGEVTE